MDNSGIGATTFDVLYTPDNNSFAFNIDGVSTISGNVTGTRFLHILLIGLVTIQVFAYGMLVVSEKVDGCSLGLTSLCPVSVGSVNINSNVDVPASVSNEIPGIAYQIPDIDGIAKIWINDTNGNPLGCVEAFLYNGKTVDQKVVGWVTAIIAGGALLSSAVASGLGHTNTAAHVSCAAVLLFGYFQAVAIAGMVSVQLPPIVAAWAQNFQWAMGIIKLTFMQTIFTWYIKSTGGTPSTLLLQPVGTNVIVEKRGLLPSLAQRSLEHLRRMHPTTLVSFMKRQSDTTAADSAITLKGIQRVAYRADIEQTNLFMTGYSFFIVLVVGSALGVASSFTRLISGSCLPRYCSTLPKDEMDAERSFVRVSTGMENCTQRNHVSPRPRWIHSNVALVPLGTCETRFGRRGCKRYFDVPHDDCPSFLCCLSRYSSGPSVNLAAPKCCLNSVLGSSAAQQMGFLVRSIQSRCLLLHRAFACLCGSQGGSYRFHATCRHCHGTFIPVLH